jgi:glycosyltransferase involved in cell wall biosynthesis
MPLRILHCIHSANPAGGGPIEGVKQLSLANGRSGHVVEVLTLDRPDAPWLGTCPVRAHAVGPGWPGYGYTPGLLRWLGRHRSDYDLVVVNGIWQYNALGVWRALRGTDTPYVVYTHGMLDPWFRRTYPLKHLKKWLYWPWADYRVLRDAAAVLFTCEEERRLARQSFWLYRCNERVVQYGTPGPAPGDGEAERLAFVARWPETSGKRCLLHLGRVHVKKAPDLVLRAFADHLRGLSAAAAPAWHLIMAGPADHDYGLAMQALAADLGLSGRVTWTGMLSGDLKWGAFRQSEAFFLPSHQENFGIVVAEALACGRPVLISDKVNIWREIEADRAAFVANDDLDGARMLLRQWTALDEGERRAMGERARACFRSRFAIEASAESFIETVTPLLRRS